MRKLIIISMEQFGYHTDSYKYCQYLNGKFDITYVSLDKGLPKIKYENINIIYAKDSSNAIKRRINLFKTILNIRSKLDKDDIIFLRYFRWCYFIKLILKKYKVIVDIRSLHLESDKKIRDKKDFIMTKECNKFDYISVITQEIADKLNLDKDKVYELKLGADKVVKTFNDIDKLSLIYVGTFDNRNIDLVIKAFNESIKSNNFVATLKIIGFSDCIEYENYIKELCDKSYKKSIKFIGRVKNDDLCKYFSDSNIGISYIPKTEFFNLQPPTKTYEYLSNGLYTISTNTYENMKIINDKNGMLIGDSYSELLNAFDYVLNKLEIKNINKREISNSVKEYSWKNICEEFNIYLNNI